MRERCKTEYFIRKDIPVKDELLSDIGNNVPEEILKILANRKVNNIKDFLDPENIAFLSPFSIYGMDRIVDEINKGIKEKKRFRLITDYDVDGITSTVIGMKIFDYLKARVTYDIPDRRIDGYGINKRLIDEAYSDNVDIIITFDNGIAAYEAIAYAKSLGMTVLVTDHHNVPVNEIDGTCKEILPPADVIVDVKQEKDTTEFKEICGAMIAFKLAQALIPNLQELPLYNELLEMACIGTICDVMPLINENRKIVKIGLNIITNSENKGIQVLKELYGLNGKAVTSYHIGFIIGPTLNAAGRLKTAKTCVDFLLSDDSEYLKLTGEYLKELNDERKQLTEDGLKKAIGYADAHLDNRILVIALEGIDESICGIIAGRIKEMYNRPVVVLSIEKDKEIAKGSGRSIKEYNMFEELSKVKELFSAFGGHSMAAGLSIPVYNIEKLKNILNNKCNLTEKDMINKILIDIQLPLHLADENFVNGLQLLEPYGEGNKKPIIADRNVKILSANVIGKNKNVVSLKLKSEAGFPMDGIFFGGIESFIQQIDKKYETGTAERLIENRRNEDIELQMSLIYNPNINEWNGKKNIQAVINYMI